MNPAFLWVLSHMCGIGVAGKNKIEGEILGADFSRTRNIKFSNDDPFTSGEEGDGYGIMRRFDYGLKWYCGVARQSRRCYQLNYGLGFAKLQSGSDNSRR